MKRLLTERGMVFRQIGTPQVLTERTHPDGKGVLRVKGVFQNYKEVNCNGRLYPKRIWESVLAEGSDFMNKVKRRGVLGILEHPDDGNTKISEASHVIVDVRMATPQDLREDTSLKEGDIIGEYEVLDTRSGRDLRALHEARCEVGISSRGNGDTTSRSGYEEVTDYDLDTWDIVYNPSVYRAKPSPVSESADPPQPPAGILNESQGNPPANHPQPQTTNMNSTAKLRSLRTQFLTLSAQSTKGIKPTAAAALVESLESIRTEASQLATEEPLLTESVRDFVGKINKRLHEMDEEDGLDSPPATPPADPATAEDTIELDPVASEVIEKAVDFLRKSDDPEANELADSLEDVTVAHDPDLEGDLTDTEVKSLPESVRGKVRALSRGHKLLLVQHSRLTEGASKLVERFKQVNKPQRGLSESASKELRERRRDMLTLGHSLTEARMPEFYAANKAKLAEAKTFEAFEDLVENLLRTWKKPAPASPKPPVRRQTTESVVPPSSRPLNEAHEVVGMIRRVRR